MTAGSETLPAIADRNHMRRDKDTGLILPAPCRLRAYHPDVVQRRPAFYIDVEGDSNVNVPVVQDHFPGLLDGMARLWREAGGTSTTTPRIPPQCRLASDCINIFNMMGKIQTEEYLSDVEVAAGVRLMLLGLHEVVWFGDEVFNGARNYPDGETAPAIRHMGRKEYNVVLMNNGDEHWRVIVLDRLRRTCWLFDSLQERQSHKLLDSQLRRFCEWAGVSDASRRVVRCPSQSSEWACGLHAINHVRMFFLEQKEEETRGDNINWMQSAVLDRWKRKIRETRRRPQQGSDGDDGRDSEETMKHDDDEGALASFLCYYFSVYLHHKAVEDGTMMAAHTRTGGMPGVRYQWLKENMEWRGYQPRFWTNAGLLAMMRSDKEAQERGSGSPAMMMWETVHRINLNSYLRL